MRTFGERSRIFRDLKLSLVEKSRHTERTTTNTNLQKTKNTDLKTTSERTSSYTSECQISPKFARTLAYAGPIRYSVTGPLRVRSRTHGGLSIVSGGGGDRMPHLPPPPPIIEHPLWLRPWLWSLSFNAMHIAFFLLKLITCRPRTRRSP